MLGKIEGRRRREQWNEMVEWHHGLNGHEIVLTPDNSEGRGSLACCSLWGHSKLEIILQLNNNNLELLIHRNRKLNGEMEGRGLRSCCLMGTISVFLGENSFEISYVNGFNITEMML